MEGFINFYGQSLWVNIRILMVLMNGSGSQRINELIYKRLRLIRLLAIGFKLEVYNNCERMILELVVVDLFGMLFL